MPLGGFFVSECACRFVRVRLLALELGRASEMLLDCNASRERVFYFIN